MTTYSDSATGRRFNNIFVVGSPQQYLFARVISKFLDGPSIFIENNSAGRFKDVFNKIDLILNMPTVSIVDYNPIEINKMHTNRIFIANRFNSIDIDIFLLLRKNSKIMCIYEDGIAFYLPYAFFNNTLSDNNKFLRFKNYSKYYLHAFTFIKRHKPNFLPMTIFDEAYIAFPDGLKNYEGQVFYILPYLKSHLNSPKANRLRTCVFMSQCIVKDNLTTSHEYKNYVISTLGKLKEHYDNVYYKSHPRDDNDLTTSILASSGVDTLPSPYDQIPIEIFCGHFENTDLYGFGTSALAYASTLFGSRSYTLIPSYLKAAPNQRLADLWNDVHGLLKPYGVIEYTP